MKEQEFENILERYPELIEQGLSFQGRQVPIGGKFIDLLYVDRYGQKLIVEVKKGAVLRTHVGQLLDYEGELLSPDDPTVRIMMVGNRVPPNLRRALDHHGLEWKELPVSHLARFLSQRNDWEYLEYVREEDAEAMIRTKLQPGTIHQREQGSATSIKDKLLAVFGSQHFGEVLTRKQIIDMIVEAYPGTNRTSVIPSDYCYNRCNRGIEFESTSHLLEYQGNARYKVLGHDFDYDGPIYWKDKQVGEWRRGEAGPRIWENIRR